MLIFLVDTSTNKVEGGYVVGDLFVCVCLQDCTKTAAPILMIFSSTVRLAPIHNSFNFDSQRSKVKGFQMLKSMFFAIITEKN